MDWLSEIEIDFENEDFILKMQYKRMSRVLREFVDRFIWDMENRGFTIEEIIETDWQWGDAGEKHFSEDAKELCVAANEGNKKQD